MISIAVGPVGTAVGFAVRLNFRYSCSIAGTRYVWMQRVRPPLRDFIEVVW